MMQYMAKHFEIIEHLINQYVELHIIQDRSHWLFYIDHILANYQYMGIHQVVVPINPNVQFGHEEDVPIDTILLY